MEKNAQSNIYPSTEPPPYSGPASQNNLGAPGPNYPGPPGPNYPGPPGGYYPGYPMTEQPQVTVVHPGNAAVIHTSTMMPAVVITNNMSPSPAPYVCRSCNQHMVTRVERTPSMRTHLFAAFLCLLGCWPCICLPYCIDTCNNAEHYCSNCNAYIGSYVG